MNLANNNIWYHLVPKGTDMREGIISPYYMLKNNAKALFRKSTDKYRERLCKFWNIYPGRNPKSLTDEEIAEGLIEARGENGLKQIYLFKFPPTEDLGPNMKKVLDGKDVYEVDLSKVHDLENIDWGYVDSNPDHGKISKDWYSNLTKEEYFAKYDDNTKGLLFAPINHISVVTTSGKINRTALKKINKESVVTEKKIERKNDKGEEIPEVCPKCGSKIGLYIKGEPVWLCSNKKCNTYFGTLPFNESTMMEFTKIPDVLYHGSSKKLSKITVHDSGVSGKYVFGTDDYKFALAYAGNQWNDLQINQAYYNGKYILTEIEKGAFKKVFDRNGYVYYMDGSTFEIPSYNERSNHEYGSKVDVVPFKVDIIPNVLEALKKNSEVTLYNYPNLPPFIKDRDEYLLKRKKLFGMTEAMKELDSTDLVKNLYENYFKESYNSINPPKPSTLGFYRTDGSGIWNSLVIENGIRWRERAETIIVKGNQVLLRFKSDDTYKVPGGGTEPTLTMEETAIKECQEEVSITPCDLKYYGSYRNKYDQSKDGYYGVICHYFVGKYKEPYKGYVDDHDLDVGMKNGSKWYNISSIMDKLIPEHKKALIDYLHLQRYYESTEDFIVESGEFAGKKRSELPDSVFGIPEERKYPMPDRKHVISAIKLFNHVEPKYEEDLAKRIIYRARKYKIDLSFVGERNRLYKYIHENTEAFESSMEGILNSFDVYTEARREVKNLEDFKKSYRFEPINMTKDDTAKIVDADIKAAGLITMGDKKYFCIIGKNIETCAFTKNQSNRTIEELVKKYPKLKEAIRNDKLNGYMYGSEYLSGTRYNSQKKHAFIMSHEQGHQELGHTTPDYRLSLDDETIIKNAKAKFNRNLQSASDKFESNKKDNNALATYKKEVKDAYKKYISEVDKNLSKKDLNANETIRSKMREEARKIFKKYELGWHSRVDEFEADLFAKIKSNQSSDQIINTLSNMYRQDEQGKNIEDIKNINIRIKNDIESRQKALNDKDIEKYKKAYDLSDKSLDKKILSEKEVKLRAKKLNKKRDLVSYNNKRERIKADIQDSLDYIKDDKEEIERLQNTIQNNYKGVTPGREKNIDKRLEDYKQTLEDDKKELNEYKAKLKALPYRTESSEGVENMDIVSKMFESFFGEPLFKKSEAESFVDSFFEESDNDSDIPDMIEPEVKKLEAKGYQVKYASPGHDNTTFKNDKNDDKIINGKYRSTGRIIFSRNYNFKNTPKGWEWKSIDNGEKKALYVKPYTYNEELGSKEQVFKRWREFYLKSLVDWIEELPEAGTDNNENKKDENFSAS